MIGDDENSFSFCGTAARLARGICLTIISTRTICLTIARKNICCVRCDERFECSAHHST